MMTRDEILAMELEPLMDRLYDDGWIVSVGSLTQEPKGYRAELCNVWMDDFERCPIDIEANGSTATEAVRKAALFAVSRLT